MGESDEIIAAGGEGTRVVGLQRILQASSDPFLGQIQTPDGDVYVRQFHDMKGAIEVETLEDPAFQRYASARVLARAHAQSPTAIDVAEHIGSGHRIFESIVSWCGACRSFIAGLQRLRGLAAG